MLLSPFSSIVFPFINKTPPKGVLLISLVNKLSELSIKAVQGILVQWVDIFCTSPSLLLMPLKRLARQLDCH